MMIKTIGTTIALAAAAGLSMTAVPIAAKSDNAAFVVNQSTCGGSVTTPEGTFSASTDDGAIQVATKSGNAMFVCNLDVTSGPEIKKAVKFEGFNCFTPNGPATSTKIVITPGGKATVVCRRRD